MGPFQKRINRIISEGLNVDPEALVEEEVEEAVADEEEEEEEKEKEEEEEEKPAHEEL
jgi:hypothetical protein